MFRHLLSDHDTFGTSLVTSASLCMVALRCLAHFWSKCLNHPSSIVARHAKNLLATAQWSRAATPTCARKSNRIVREREKKKKMKYKKKMFRGFESPLRIHCSTHSVYKCVGNSSDACRRNACGTLSSRMQRAALCS